MLHDQRNQGGHVGCSGCDSSYSSLVHPHKSIATHGKLKWVTLKNGKGSAPGRIRRRVSTKLVEPFLGSQEGVPPRFLVLLQTGRLRRIPRLVEVRHACPCATEFAE